MVKKIALFLGILSIILLGFFSWQVFKKVGLFNNKPYSSCENVKASPAPSNGLVKIGVGGKDLWVKFAKSREEKIKGLSGRDALPENEGLLFSYDNPQKLTFWMKDMFFPIDIVFIKDSKIIGISENALPSPPGTDSEQIAKYSSPGLVNAVLEVNAFWCRQNGVEIGDFVEIHTKTEQ
jgi:uncharacterized membrane protein (UPF0127 family)